MPTAWRAKADSVNNPLPLCSVFGMPRVFKKTVVNKVRRHMRPHRFAFGLYFQDRKAPGITPMAKHYLFYGIKLPFMLLLIILGFMMEFIVVLPFAVLAQMDARRRCK
jgi:hypothetical protein